ncbi:hypothetical protein GGR51DRAFT_561390 [Nemania sp. FL0031]|nr:hypothetical protein GGR51DRAFT_561390 [Nemania sp. FL0031]
MQFNPKSLLLLGLTASSVVSVASRIVKEQYYCGKKQFGRAAIEGAIERAKSFGVGKYHYPADFQNKDAGGNNIFSPHPKEDWGELYEFPLLTSGQPWGKDDKPGIYRVIMDGVLVFIGLTEKDADGEGVHECRPSNLNAEI